MAAFGTLLAGCVGNGAFQTFGAPGAPASEGEGVCSAFERPQYAIVGKTAYDQLWSNRITEAGVAGCGWRRPEPRPATLEEKPVPLPKAKPPSRWQKLKSKIKGKPVA
jgi:hypothetical protein